jgi:uncharacterized repeat protein (TIGR03806 family)
MKTRMPLPALILALSGGGCGDPLAGVDRSYATQCRLVGGPTEPPKIKLTRYLSGAALENPVHMVPLEDGSRRVLLVLQGGRILVSAAPTPMGTAADWLDLRDRVTAGGETGLLAVALDPRYRQSGRLYVNYTTQKNGPLRTLVSRFRVPMPGSTESKPDPRGEQVLLTVNQPFANHNGGQIAFGPDGYLYIGMGDGGSGGDPINAGQRMDTLLGKMLRIDVGTDDATYRIPADNPFFKGQGRAVGTGADNSHCRDAGKAGTCGEIWALGLRNPWRFSFDPVGGALWAGDVGQGAREEIDLIERGKNYGWRCMEGTQVYNNEPSCQQARAAKAFTPPVAEYGRDEGKSVTGGVVYRGKALPGLYGAYLFADYVDGNLWALQPGADGKWARTTIATAVGNISSFGVDADGEVYVLEHQRGQLLRIEAAAGGQGQPGWPARLSETGCFSDLQARRLQRGALSYGLNMPLWSDGAAKERALVLPAGGVLRPGPMGTGMNMSLDGSAPFMVPAGSVLIKTFLLEGAPVETRFLVWDGEEVRGATYRWDGADAFLLSAATTERIGGQTWYFPSRGDCRACHTRAAGGVLGLSVAQLNRRHDVFGTGEVSQLDALTQIGYLEGVGPAAEQPRFPEPGEEGAGVAERARAYLHSNCGSCHMPGGLSNATIDLRFGTALQRTGACGVKAQHGDLGVAGAQILAPGKPEQSTLYLRMKSTDPMTRMPPLASAKVDEVGAELVRAWIAGLAGCQ